MNNELGKIKLFTDLDAWKEAHRLVLMVYEETKTFPREELFGLVSQMRRCSVSISSNIAEGFSRPSYQEKSRFYSISLGSTTELQNQLILSKDVNFIREKNYHTIFEQSIKVHKIVNGLIKGARAIAHNS